jgi:hypothetical protein
MNVGVILLQCGIMPRKPKEPKFDKLGYSALALYVTLLAAAGLGVYGINVSTVIMDQNRSDRVREQMKTGRMVMSTEDRTQCRSIRFDNETAELGRETLTECDRKIGSDSGSSFGLVRDGFMKR